jgi:hypothetical protein
MDPWIRSTRKDFKNDYELASEKSISFDIAQKEIERKISEENKKKADAQKNLDQANVALAEAQELAETFEGNDIFKRALVAQQEVVDNLENEVRAATDASERLRASQPKDTDAFKEASKRYHDSHAAFENFESILDKIEHLNELKEEAVPRAILDEREKVTMASAKEQKLESTTTEEKVKRGRFEDLTESLRKQVENEKTELASYQSDAEELLAMQGAQTIFNVTSLNFDAYNQDGVDLREKSEENAKRFDEANDALARALADAEKASQEIDDENFEGCRRDLRRDSGPCKSKEDRYNEVRDALEAAKDDLSGEENTLEDLKSAVARIETVDIAGIDRQIGEKNDARTRFQNILDDGVDNPAVHEAIAAIDVHLSELQGELGEANIALKSAQEDVGNQESKLTSFASRVSEAKDNFEDAEKDYSGFLDRRKASDVLQEKFQAAKDLANKAQKTLENSQAALQDWESSRDAKTEELASAKKALDDSTKTYRYVNSYRTLKKNQEDTAKRIEELGTSKHGIISDLGDELDTSQENKVLAYYEKEGAEKNLECARRHAEDVTTMPTKGPTSEPTMTPTAWPTHDPSPSVAQTSS